MVRHASHAHLVAALNVRLKDTCMMLEESRNAICVGNNLVRVALHVHRVNARDVRVEVTFQGPHAFRVRTHLDLAALNVTLASA